MRLIFITLLALVYSCKPQVAQNSEASEFLNLALDANGGLERWQQITELAFTKKTNMYLPDSSIESESLQRQTFRNAPMFYGEIEYLFDTLERKIVQEGDKVTYFEKGKPINDEEKLQKAATAIQIAYYVIALPYKLMDEGVEIKDISNERLSDGRGMKCLHVQHAANPEENWWIYFNPHDYLMSGYLIEHDNRFSYILNDLTANINGFEFPLSRRSIALDSTRNNPYLRADYTYSDIMIK